VPVDIYNASGLVCSACSPVSFAKKLGLSKSAGLNIQRTINRDLSKPSIGSNIHHYKGYWVIKTDVDLDRASSECKTFERVKLIDPSSGTSEMIYRDDSRMTSNNYIISYGPKSDDDRKGMKTLRHFNSGICVSLSMDDPRLLTDRYNYAVL
jgi:hypothetical protein